MIVSVIIASYNAAAFISRTLDAIFAQRGLGERFELDVIVVDDCSTDETRDIVATQYPQVTLLSTPKNSGGPNKGRNIGIKASKGEYFCIVDHDDIWMSDRVLKTLPFLGVAPIISAGYLLTDARTKRVQERIKSCPDGFMIYEKNQTFLTKLAKSKEGQHAYLGGLILHYSLKSVFFEETYGMVDYDWILRLFEGQRSLEICDAVYERIVDGSNLSLNEAYRKHDFTHSLAVLEQYKHRYPDEVKKGIRRLHGTMGRYYYLRGNMKLARTYFLQSERKFLTLAYLLTSFVGHSFIRKYVHIFG